MACQASNMPGKRPRYSVGSMALMLVVVGLLQGCASTGGGTANQDDSFLSKAARYNPHSIYDELGYWPLQDEAMTDAQMCRPASVEIVRPQIIAVPAQEDLWSRVRAGYGFNEEDVDERRVDRQLAFYSDQQQLFDKVSERASKYMYYVVQQLEERDMPLELALLPMLESGYNPSAVSRSHAAGMWQFVPGTASHYGLQQNSWYDGRKDVVASTDAALDHLEDLHQQFGGDWYLALAAYNSGEGNVQRAIDRNRRLGKPTDYWSLDLSRQACNYVPRLLALARVLEEPENHGVIFSAIPNQPSVVAVEVDGQINLARTVSRAGIDSGEFFTLNPAYKRAYTEPNTKMQVLIPSGQEQDFVAAMDMPDEQAHALPYTRSYHIRSGDSLLAIARLHQTTVEALRTLNGLHGDAISAGANLLIPSDAVIPEYEFAQETPAIYVVKSGDSLWRIAKHLGTTVEKLAALNGIKPSVSLRIGQRLKTSGSAGRTGIGAASRDVKPRLGYWVNPGDDQPAPSVAAADVAPIIVTA